jgi:hypothetical protein
MTQLSTFGDNGDHRLSSPAVIDTLMRGTHVMAIGGFALSVYALSFATQHCHSILSLEVSESAAPQLAREIEEDRSDGSAGNPR